MEGKINRLVFDEAHKVFIEDNFRASFLRIRELAQFPIQKIFLSATLPPYLEEYFLMLTSLPSSTLVIRAPTPRPNLRYHAMTVEPQIKSAVTLAKELSIFLEEKTFAETSRGIIYCTDIATTDALANAVKGYKSHSQMWSNDLWQHQGLWREGDRKWMVATTSFLHGINYPDVRAIIFVNIPFGSMNIEQGAGRAGRNGKVANIFVLHPLNQVWIGRHQQLTPTNDPQCIKHAIEWVTSRTECRRYGMSLLMDGNGTFCKDLENAAQCDICEPENPITAATRKFLCGPSHPSPARNTNDGVDVNMLEITEIQGLDYSPLFRVIQISIINQVIILKCHFRNQPLHLPTLEILLKIQINIHQPCPIKQHHPYHPTHIRSLLHYQHHLLSIQNHLLHHTKSPPCLSRWMQLFISRMPKSRLKKQPSYQR